MRQQHAFSLSTRFFSNVATSHPLFPDKAGCCFVLLVFRSFYYSFKTKAKVGTTSQRVQKNLPPCPPWSTNLPQLWPNDAPNEVRTNDMWGDIEPISFSFSRTKKKKKPLSYFSQWRLLEVEKIWRTATCEKWTSSLRENRENSSSTSTDSNVNVNLESAIHAWFGTSKGLLQSRDCTTVRLVRYQ